MTNSIFWAIVATILAIAVAIILKPDPARAEYMTFGPSIEAAPQEWWSIMAEIPDTPTVDGDLERTIDNVVRDIRRIEYPEDEGDEWQRPSTTRTRGAGDCEDLAILAMWMLTAAGVDPERMQVVVVRWPMGAHAILQVDSDDGPWFIDSLPPRISRQPRASYRPAYALGVHGKTTFIEVVR